jgi:hypothetical protein
VRTARTRSACACPPRNKSGNVSSWRDFNSRYHVRANPPHAIGIPGGEKLTIPQISPSEFRPWIMVWVAPG